MTNPVLPTTHQTWIRRGLVFNAGRHAEWATTHAALPIAQQLSGGLTRIHFCSRDQRGRAQIGFLEFDLDQPGVVSRISERPTIQLGPLGAFDDSGLTSSCLVDHDGRHFLFYTGWSLGVTVPFYYGIGLAVSSDGGLTFEKVSQAPILGRHHVDPFLCASPSVIIEDGVWRMWYVSGVGWRETTGDPQHLYHIRYAESDDGLNWRRNGRVCVDFANEDEYAFGRPCVLKDQDCYRMWYCYRGDRYRLGYAESSDGLHWIRQDRQAGLEPAIAGWDGEMIAYPHVFDQQSTRWMLYNGNGYGRSGFGLAMQSSERVAAQPSMSKTAADSD